MKDKKFTVMIALGAIWVVLFIALMFGAKIHPRVEQLVTFLCVAWFTFWTLSIIFTKNKTTHNVGDHLTGKCGCYETKKEQDASEKETTKK